MGSGLTAMATALMLLSGAVRANEPPPASDASSQSAPAAGAGTLRIYVGTYTTGAGRGIYLVEMDPERGALMVRGLVGEIRNPSFLALHPGGRFLYAVGETGDFEGGRSGSVSAFAVEPGTGMLTPLNQRASGGQGPCHLVVDRGGRNVLVANYSSGTAAVLPIGPDGRLGEPACVVRHEGSGPHPRRQQSPHAHSINLDPAGRFAFVADLGVDRVYVYRFDPAAGTLSPHEPPWAQVARAAGPRHLAFHPCGRYAYVINELACTVTAFAYDPARGVLEEVQTVATLPREPAESDTTADIHVHPSGRFVYGSNRGHDSIAVFAVDEGTGRLTARGHVSTAGSTPRNFGIDPSGRWLIAANQKSDSLVVFRIDPADGGLEPNGVRVEVPSPVCVIFAAPPGR